MKHHASRIAGPALRRKAERGGKRQPTAAAILARAAALGTAPRPCYPDRMPEPTPHHRRLHVLAGSWRGDETLYPSPWAPEQQTAIGTFEIRVAVDGLFLLSDYEESQGGAVVFRGHGVYGWDPTLERYTMYWVDSMGRPNQALGIWDADRLVFTGEQGSTRYIYTIVDADHFSFRIEIARDDASWSPLMDGSFVRVP